MRKVILLISFFTGTITYSQSNPTKIYGTVAIDNNVSMKVTEVTIQEWMCFIVNNGFNTSLFPDSNKVSPSTRLLFNDLSRTKDFEYLKVIDHKGRMKENFGAKSVEATKSLRGLIGNNSDYISINKPITGISYQQAKQFCRWKEGLINASQVIQFNISLPSVDIYKNVITDKDSLNQKKCAQFNSMNCNCESQRNSKDDKFRGKALLRVDSYWPTELGLYNLQGNAAEMTNEEGIAMGGSFKHNARQSYRDTKQQYSSSADWLGFRYVVTIK